MSKVIAPALPLPWVDIRAWSKRRFQPANFHAANLLLLLILRIGTTLHPQPSTRAAHSTLPTRSRRRAPDDHRALNSCPVRPY